jgi:Chain length determinant protein
MPDSAELHTAQRSSLREYVTTIRRRKWVIAQAVLLLPAAAIAFSLHQQKLFRADAQVLLSQQNLANQLTGVTDPSQFQQPDRVAQTQADLARVPEVARRTLAAAGISDRTPDEFLSESSVTAKTNANLLDFAVTEPSASLAARLVNEYDAAVRRVPPSARYRGHRASAWRGAGATRRACNRRRAQVGPVRDPRREGADVGNDGGVADGERRPRSHR